MPAKVSPVRLASPTRLLAGGAGLILAALLATAATLSPDERGFGTHEQLGLGPCTFADCCGVRCPSCGMTTAWSWLLHGRPEKALATHAVGTLLGAAAVLGAVWLGVAAIGGQWRWLAPSEAQALWSLAAVVMAGLVEWAVRLTAG